MAYRCVICNKGTMSGSAVSHSNRHTKRKFKPNLQRVRLVLNGHVTRAWVCTACIKSGKVQKPPLRTRTTQ